MGVYTSPLYYLLVGIVSLFNLYAMNEIVHFDIVLFEGERQVNFIVKDGPMVFWHIMNLNKIIYIEYETSLN